MARDERVERRGQLRASNVMTLAVLLCVLMLSANGRVAFAGDDEVPADPRAAARETAVAAPVLTEREQALIRRPDRKRAARQLSLPLFGRPLTLGGRYTLLFAYEHDRLLDFDFLNLDDADFDGDGDFLEPEDAAEGRAPDEDRLLIVQGLLLDLFYPITDRISVYVSGRGGLRSIPYASETREGNDWIAERSESWLFLGNVLDSPMSFQIGRQRIFEGREWWWDANLDSVRMRFDLKQLHLELAAAQALGPTTTEFDFTDPEEDDVLRVLFQGTWEWRKRHDVSLYTLHHRDHSDSLSIGRCEQLPPNVPPGPFFDILTAGCLSERDLDESDATLTWFGLSATGRLKLRRYGKLYYWIDVAGVIGNETLYDLAGPTGMRRVGGIDEHPVRGWGLDVRATWEMKVAARPRLTLGYAYGSGEKGATVATDGSFRQTGLQDNNGKFLGVDSFRYYGELLDPEPSNLHLVTAALGFPLLKNSSVEFVYHYYRQAEAAPFLRDVSFKRDPLGEHTSIGHEWDLILGIEEWGPIELEFIAALFRAGKAFEPDDGRLSVLGIARLRLNF